MKWFLEELARRGDVSLDKIAEALENPHKVEELVRLASHFDAVAFGLRFLPHHFRSPPAPFHYVISERLAKRDYYAVAAPRGHAKSTLVGLAHPLLEAASGRAKFILLIGADAGAAEDRLEDVLNELADNDALLDEFPHLRPPDPGELKKWAKARKKFKQRRSDFVSVGGIRFSARGAGQALRGMKQGAQRPDLIILDDVDTDQRCDSPRQLVKLARWFDTVIMNLEGVERARIRIAGTKLCHRALISQLVERWHGDTFKAIVDEERGKTLWPAVWPYERLIEKRDGGYDDDGSWVQGIGPRRFAREYQNDPASEDETFLTEEQVTFVATPPPGYPKSGYYTAGLDLAVGMSEKSSQNAIVLMWHSPANVTYIIAAERWRGVAGLEDRVRRFIEENALQTPRLIAVEAVQYQMKAVLDLTSAMPYRFVPVHPDRSKSARFALIADRFVNGQITMLNGLPTWFKEELFSFPIGTFTWDGIDATVYAYLAKFEKGRSKRMSTAILQPSGGGDWQ